MLSGVLNIHDCSQQERAEHIAYLRSTPVDWVAEKLRRGASLAKGEIHDREIIGALKTFWGDLDGANSSVSFRRDKFLVKEVLRVLRSQECSDKATLETILSYMELDRRQTLQIKITLLCLSGNDSVIVDGNKRAVACYQVRPANSFGAIPLYLVNC